MRLTGTVIAGAVALFFALTAGRAVPPAAAGEVCDELGLRDNCVESSDLKARLDLEEANRHARLRLKDRDGETAVELDARSGNVTNLFSDDPDESNGLVKAWAQIRPDGEIIACWRCNKDPDETRRLFRGTYEVDFTPLGPDIRTRPRALTLDGGPLLPEVAVIRGQIRSGDASSVLVEARSATTGETINTVFTLLVY